MDFLGLFDPSASEECGDGNENFTDQLPPEPQMGNVEYKLKLVNPSKQRFEHLVTQMKWRLREGQGEAIYEIGVEDNGVLTGLSEYEMTVSLHTLQQMAYKLGATTTVLRERIVDSENGNRRKIAEVLVRKTMSEKDKRAVEKRKALMEVKVIEAKKAKLLKDAFQEAENLTEEIKKLQQIR